MILYIEAKPNSKCNEIKWIKENTLKIKIKAPAIEGKANEAIIQFLSEVFKTSKSKIKILKGSTSMFKKMDVDLDEFYIRNILTKNI